jgi:epoxyqueuosine reductase
MYTSEPSFQPITFAPSLITLAGLSEEEFRAQYRRSPIWRAKYSGFLRNVAYAIGNTGTPETRAALVRLANHESESVRVAATEALSIFDRRLSHALLKEPA